MLWVAYERFIFAFVISLFGLALAANTRAQDADPKSLEKQALELFGAGDYSNALSAAERWATAAENAEIAKCEPGYETARALGNVAWYALFAKNSGRALKASQRALSLAPETLWIETNYAHALLFAGRTGEAIALYVRHKGETIPDAGKWDVIIRKDFAEFRRRGLGHRSFAQVEKALAEASESPEALNESALKLANAGRPKDALPLAQKYAAAVEARDGAEHTKYALALENLAFIYKEQGQFDQIEPLLKKTIEIKEHTLGNEHPDTLSTLNNLAFPALCSNGT